MRRVVSCAGALGLICGTIYVAYFLPFEMAFPMGFSVFAAFFALVGGYWLWLECIVPRRTV
jgi:hypothetical protein